MTIFSPELQNVLEIEENDRFGKNHHQLQAVKFRAVLKEKCNILFRETREIFRELVIVE